MTEATSADVRDGAVMAIAGVFLDGLVNRDFAAMHACLRPDIAFRALVGRGPVDEQSADRVMAWFIRWFGGEDAFEVVDAAIGQIGPKLYLRWRVRLSSDEPVSHRMVEQHAFVTAGSRIESMDLLCSGFQLAG